MTQHTLAKCETDRAALEQFRKLLELDRDKGTDESLVSALLNPYRVHLHASRKSAVPGVFEFMAHGFSEKLGHLRVSQLQPRMVEE